MKDYFMSQTQAQNDENQISENTIEIINTDIGYNNEELKATSTDDLIVLRRAIYSYLKSPNLKKRNPNYLKLFRRLNEELKNRNYNFGENSTERKLSKVKNLLNLFKFI